MINLLPLAVKKKITKEYWVRVVSVWFFILSIALVLVSLLLLPVYVLIGSQISVYETTASEVAAKVEDFDVSAVPLAKANSQAQKLFELRKVKHFSDLVNDFNSLENVGLEISSLKFERDNGLVKNAYLSGTAKSRKDLSDFRAELVSMPEVKSVDLPISNLAKDRDIDFDLTVEFKVPQ